MLFDPGPRNFGIKKVDTYRLFCGIKHKKDGLWCICEPKELENNKILCHIEEV